MSIADSTVADFHHEGRCCPFLADHIAAAVQAERERADRLVSWKDTGFRERDKWRVRAEQAEAAIERHGECICNTGPGTDGPEEFCPWHGRPYNDALDYMGEIIKSERTRAEGLHDASMRRQLRMIRTLEDALGIDPDDADACVPGCDEGAGGLEHDLHHLIERDAARGAAIKRARAVLGDAHEVIDRGGIRREAYIPADRVRAALDDQEATDGGAP